MPHAARASALILLALALPLAAHAQTATPVPSLDLTHYMGVWYKLALFPNKAEKHCVRDAVVLNAARYKPRHFSIVTACHTDNSDPGTRNANATQDKSGSGKIKLGWIWPFTHTHLVLASDPAFNWTLVGTPNHKQLWILSRTNTLTPEQRADINAKAAAKGFDPAKLVDLPSRTQTLVTKPPVSSNLQTPPTTP